MRVQFNVSLPVRLRRDKNLFIAECPLLDVVSQGGTEARAIESLIEAIQLFMISCFERGVLVEVLKERGLHPRRPGEVDDEESGGVGDRMVDVPLPLLVAQRVQANHAH